MHEKQTPSGYLLINKPKDITSFDCIRHIKRIVRQKIKIGHAGTLDPFATGLVIICLGRDATKSITELMNLDKTYIVKAKLGELTDTLDLTGEVLEAQAASLKLPAQEEIEQAIKKLGTNYTQTPPIYSALKHQGTPLYKLAREKQLTTEELEKIIKKKTREITIYSLKLENFDPPFFSFRTRVSKGTYIRSLANDIAKKAGSYATTYELQRVNVGKISLEKSIALDRLKTIDDIYDHLLTKEQITQLL